MLRGRPDRTRGCRMRRRKASAGGPPRVSRGRVGRMRALRAPLQTLDGKNRGAVSGRSRWEPWGLFGFSVFRLAPFVPAAKIKGDRHAGGAQFVRKGAVDHGTSHDHASDGQGSDSLRGGAATPPILSQAPPQDAHHSFEDGLEGAPRTYAATSDVSRQRDHGAGVFDILEMLARQISADDLRPYVGR